MRIIKGKYGTCYMTDFLTYDGDLGKFELCLTDPSYNVKAKAHDQSKLKLDKKFSYDDNMTNDEYLEFSAHWYSKVIEMVKMLIFSPGHKNIALWHDMEIPKDYLFHYKTDGQGFSRCCRTTKTELYLVYGGLGNKRLNTNTIIANINHHIRLGPHPHPKPRELYRKILEQLKPDRVLDPFTGSGSVAIVCEELGIPWVAFEKDERFGDWIEQEIKAATGFCVNDNSYLEI